MTTDVQPGPERVGIALDAVYQTEAIVNALEALAKDYDPSAMPLLLVSMCKRIGDLNGVIMSALGDKTIPTHQMRSTLGNV